MSSCITTMRSLLALILIVGLASTTQVRASIPEKYDPFNPAANPGEISKKEIIVRFTGATAARMHAERIAKGLTADMASTNTYAPDVDSFDPSIVAGLTPSITASFKAEKLVAQAPEVKLRLSKSAGADKDAFDKAAKAIENEADKSTYGALGLYVVKLAPGANPITVCRQMMARPDVVYAEPKRIYHTMSTPNDANFFLQWNLTRIGVPEAWDLVDSSPLLTTPSQVGVVVVDSGVRLSHKDLTKVTDKNHAIDVELGNGDAYAANQNNENRFDMVGHGTAVAGIIMAKRNNADAGVYHGGGIAGIASNGNSDEPGFVLYVVNADAQNTSDSSTLGLIGNWWDGVYWFENSGATSVNMSFGSYGGSPLQVEVDAMRTIARARMLSFVSSGNNDGNADITFPAVLPTAISVGGVDTEDLRVTRPKWWYGSNYGSTLDIMGLSQGLQFVNNHGNPDIINGEYWILGLSNLSNEGIDAQFNGTSAASPHLSGVAAMMKYVNPALSPTQIRNILYKTAQDQIGDPAKDTPGFDIYYGHGLVNALAATQLAKITEGAGGNGSDDAYEFTGTGDTAVANNTYVNARLSDDFLGQWLTDYKGPGLSWDRDWYLIPVFQYDSIVRVETFHHRADGHLNVSLHHPDTNNTLGYVDADTDYAYFDRKVPTIGYFGLKVDGSLLGAAYDMRVTVYPPGEIPPDAVPPEADPLDNFDLNIKRSSIENNIWEFYP